MIVSFRHRGLKRLFEHGDRRRVSALHVPKLELILADLDAADTIEHLRRPGYRLHKLKGNRADQYAIDVSCNWRIVFRLSAGQVFDVDLVDYH
ncbi:MAG: Killer protein [Rhodobacteraceae bacterium]|nr:Killer protein [Paracoccaceae bacterium]